MAEETRTDKGLRKEARIANPIPKRLFNLREAAQYLGRPVSGVRTLIWSGKLPFLQEGRKQYIDIKDIDSFIERCKTTMV
ncbi:MAG: helix-turn-helix domain-containing protein [Syntrophales bacterium]|jgi:excisionase family DNA binding protein